MKKLFLLFYSTFIIHNSTFSQGGVWTWISGDSTLSAAGVYGTQGIPSVNNHPPASYEYVEWKDKQGNFWIYGGTYPNKADLWKYNPPANTWTWVKGNGLSNVVPVYGTQGVAAITNTPGSRGFCSATWTDTTGNLWLFGAVSGGSRRNDLWRYSIGTNEWTWIKGDSTGVVSGVHGTLGIPSAANVPGSRDETCSAWTDSLNNLWLFGGTGYDEAGTFGSLNDLMKYNIATNEWTWMSGDNLKNAVSNYGTKGIAAASNVPGARRSYTKWKETENIFWMMGGYDTADHNDVWRYNSTTNEWTWMAGTNLINDSGVYQATCMNDTLNIPHARREQRASVTDNCRRFWMFGGLANTVGVLENDLWIFDTQQLKWNWVSGTNVANDAGNFGVLGIASASNLPPSRYGAIAWWGNDNKLYLFAGSKQGTISTYCDLWVFVPDTSCVSICYCDAAVPEIIQSGDTLFVPDNYAGYQWFFGSTQITGATNYFYVATQSGNYNIIATDSNGCSAGAGILNVIASLEFGVRSLEFEVFPNPAKDNITVAILNLQSSIFNLNIYNSLGEKVYLHNNEQRTNNYPPKDGFEKANELTIPLKDFSDGIYIMCVQSPSGIRNRKFIVSK